MSFRFIPLVATTALLASGSAALAQSATATTDVNVRSGPGPQYAVIDSLPAGERVNIVDCRGEWCEIGMGGDSGFVARSYLDDGYGRSRTRVYERQDEYDGGEQVAIERDDPGETEDLVVGGYYESRPFYIREGYYYWGGRWYARRPGAPGWRTGSWRRWEERRGGPRRDDRANRPPRDDDRRARIDRGDDGQGRRFQRMERRDAPDRERAPDRQRERDGGGRAAIDRDDGARGGGERGGGQPRASEPGRGGGDVGQRAERPEARGGGAGPGVTGGGRAPDGGGRTPGAGSNDRGDRIGLDRAGSGGGGRNDR